MLRGKSRLREIMRTLSGALVILFCSMLMGTASAFEFEGNKWPGAKALVYLDLDGVAASGISWNTAFTTAMLEWNTRTPFTFSRKQEKKNPCISDGFSGVDFSTSYCGSEFGTKTLAVTLRRLRSSVLGPANLIEADIVINANENFNVYNGDLYQPGISGLDMQRIALHELGHVLGLSHESSAPAIMAPNIGNLYRLQGDDIQGVEKLYGGLQNCAIKSLTFGVIDDALSDGDCTVDQLTLGSDDSTYIDLYRFNVSSTTTFTFTMSSLTLESVLLLADSDLNVLVYDPKSSTNLGTACGSSLTATLSTGTYYLMANTFNSRLRDECDRVGQYQISTTYSTSDYLSLNAADSLTGGPGFGSYRGGITANNGVSYGNQFRATDTLDVTADIVIDPSHQGQPGFLVVAATFDGATYLINSVGDLVLFEGDVGAIDHVRDKILAGTETLNILTDLVPASIGVSALVVDFVVGYGVDTNPGEVYFHTTPLNLTIIP